MPRVATGNGVVKVSKQTVTLEIAARELRTYWNGKPVTLTIFKEEGVAKEGFLLRTTSDGVEIVSPSDIGLLYGTYHLLRLQEQGKWSEFAAASKSVLENPQFDIRLLNHWDNLNGTVERGYAGQSLWQWSELPETVSLRYEAYARANASIGINGTVINNVNASPLILGRDYLLKVKTLADLFRPYGIKTYLSINFASPIHLGGLSTADPLDKAVIRWWSEKVDEIYQLIPDFGGFLVKANSEGEPGPTDFGRTHAEGANMLADALAHHKGIVMWRAFVYESNEPDRAKQAYQLFKPLDGRFRKNVILQVKNGPLDFQPREPYHPLFGAMKRTPTLVEFQITQEYLGFSNHLAYLAPIWKEFFYFVKPKALKAISGVANIGTDINWCGHPFAQSNWYAFGRMAWNPSLTCEEIAQEWLAQTFTSNPQFVEPLSEMMIDSREAVVDYMMPLGLHHLFAWSHHYGPEPWCDVPGARVDWLPSYYHNATKEGIGFNRSSTGSQATAQYPKDYIELFDNRGTCPEIYLLWFHHVPWTHLMKSGHTLWEELCYKYDRGVEETRRFQKIWDRMEPYVDKSRFTDVQRRLKIQTRDAIWWKNACLLYFQEFSGMPIPHDLERPIYQLEEMKRFRMNITNYETTEVGFTR
ncbi:MAG: alpha-glucuronidase [Phocaeicola sp.]